MRLRTIVVSATVLLAACNGTPKTTETSKDSTAVFEREKSIQKTAATSTASIEKKQTTFSSTEDRNETANSSASSSSESENTAKTKNGWSKTAKGAVIGGVVGAGTGAAVNKKNRVAGAVVGGVVGAGAGAIIGNEMDKKDGRH